MSSINSRLRNGPDWTGRMRARWYYTAFDYYDLARQFGRGTPAIKALVRQARRKAAKQRAKRGNHHPSSSDTL